MHPIPMDVLPVFRLVSRKQAGLAMEKTLLSIDGTGFNLPWTRPDFFRLHLWYQQFCRNVGQLECTPVLFGDFWSSGQSDIPIIQIWVELDVSNILNHEILAEKVRNFLRVMFVEGLNEHRMFIEISVVDLGVMDRFYNLVQATEKCAGTNNIDESLLPIRLDVFQKYEFFRDDQSHMTIENQPFDEAKFGDNVFYMRSKKHLVQLLHNASMGRVYLPPIPLKTLYSRKQIDAAK